MRNSSIIICLFIPVIVSLSLAQAETLHVEGNEWTLVADIYNQSMPSITLEDGAEYIISVEGNGLNTKWAQTEPFRYIILWEASTNGHYFVSAE